MRESADTLVRLCNTAAASGPSRYYARMIIVTVMYPKTSESRFDFSYYLDKHIPLVKARFTKLGMEKLDLMRGTAALDGGQPNFALIAQLQFSSVEHLRNALAEHGEEIIGDIPKFTNVQPLIQMNERL